MKILIIGLVSILIFDNCQSQTTSFSLVLDRLYCKEKTESSEDEVYFIIEGSKSSNSYFSREPGTSIHWSMNNDPSLGDDKNVSYSITNKILFTGELKNGETQDLNVILLEEDGFNTIKYQSKASAMLASTGNPYAAAAGAVISVLTALGIGIENTDDWMGMFALRVTNTNGDISVSWRMKDGVYAVTTVGDALYPNKRFIKMNHDGSDYWAYLNVVPKTTGQTVHIRSVWKNAYLAHGSSALSCCTTDENSGSKFILVRDESDPRYCTIQTENGNYISRNGTSIQFTSGRNENSVWFLEEVAGAPGQYRIKYVANSTYIQIESGSVNLTMVPDFWLSAKWKLEPV